MMPNCPTAEAGTVAVLYRRHLFGSTDRTTAPAGLTVAEIVDRLDLPPRIRPFLAVAVGDRLVSRSAWHLTRPKPGAQMTALAVPQGGGGGNQKALRTAATLDPGGGRGRLRPCRRCGGRRLRRHPGGLCCRCRRRHLGRLYPGRFHQPPAARMTGIVTTVTASRAWLSADTFLTALPAVINSPGAPRTTFGNSPADIDLPDTPTPVEPPVCAGHAEKVTVNPTLRVVTAGAGMLAPIDEWRSAVRFAAWRDFDDLADRAPDTLRTIARNHPAAIVLGLNIVLLGWSPRHRRCTGASFMSARDFDPIDLSGGHGLFPPYWPKDETAPALAAMWPEAETGYDVESFHLGVGRAQARSSQRGCYSQGALGIGGMMSCGRVSANGAELIQLGRLDYQPCPWRAARGAAA